MIITPRILRSQELTAADLAPMYVGTGQSFGANTVPQLITPQPPITAGGTITPQVPASTDPPGTPPVTPLSSPPAGAATPPAVAVPPPAGGGRAVGIVPVTPADPAAPPPAPAGAMRIAVTAPSTPLQMGGQPYTVPLSVTNGTGLSSVTLTLTFNPAVLRATVVNEGSVMRADGATTTFVPQIDPSTGRIDLAITRPGGLSAASASGILASIVFEAIGEGTSQIALSGVAVSAAGQMLSVQFAPATVTVR
jgi:hypothetical protein